MAAVVCFTRLPGLADEYRTELQRIAGVDVEVVEVASADTEAVLAALRRPWTAIWARALPEHLREPVDAHVAVQLVAVRAPLHDTGRALRNARQGRDTDVFVRFDRRFPDGTTEPVADNALL